MSVKKLEHLLPSEINYKKSNGESSDRVIIPTFIPHNSVKALDVTNLSSEDRAELVNRVKEYDQYFKNFVSTAFSFDDWLTHTYGEESKKVVKWRTFKTDGIEVK